MHVLILKQLLMIMFCGSKRVDNQSALKDKYETAEQALQKKWNKYCSRGNFFYCCL